MSLPAGSAAAAGAFRTTFHFTENVNWFPGHMLKSMRELGDRLKMCHAVLEVRDARIPVSSANSSLNSIIQGKRRVIFFNKSDLVDAPHVRALAARFEVAGARCVFGSTLDANCAPKILESLSHAILQTPAPRIDPAAAFAHPKYCAKSSTDAPSNSRQSQSVVAIVGMPNVGKSSLINCLRRHAFGHGHAVRTGAEPGLTRTISAIRVQQQPPLLVLDTPGVLVPATRLESLAGLKLALASCIKDKAVGEVLLVDLLLFLLNQPAAGAARFAYVRAFGLAAPLDDVDVLLEHVGRRLGLLAAGNRVNEEQAAKHVLAQYRAGKLGKFLLDNV